MIVESVITVSQGGSLVIACLGLTNQKYLKAGTAGIFECIIYRDEESVYADSSLTRRYYRGKKSS